MTAKPAKLGVVWTASAKCYDGTGRLVGTCMDTPNAIAKAMMEQPAIDTVKSLAGFGSRRDYADRMADWNVAESHFREALKTR